MLIKDGKYLLAEMKEKIKEIVDNFEKETELYVDNIYLKKIDTTTFSDKKKTYENVVEIKASIE